jgi:Protein of unknown function (DUF2512).
MVILIATIISIGLVSRNSMGWALVIAFIVTAFNLLVGDLLMLETLGNITASISDGILAVLTVYAIDNLFPDINTGLWGLTLLILLISGGEYIFHIYLLHLGRLKSHLL